MLLWQHITLIKLLNRQESSARVTATFLRGVLRLRTHKVEILLISVKHHTLNKAHI